MRNKTAIRHCVRCGVYAHFQNDIALCRDDKACTLRLRMAEEANEARGKRINDAINIRAGLPLRKDHKGRKPLIIVDNVQELKNVR